ncbi:hypothetical protein EON65_22020 [archaeon]|nr:MAG: hypothetical protein EON65_22020 [archaeon]
MRTIQSTVVSVWVGKFPSWHSNIPLGERFSGAMLQRETSGWASFSSEKSYGQCIILHISGDKRSFEVAENEVLRLTDENGAAYWDFEVEREDSIYALLDYHVNLR